MYPYKFVGMVDLKEPVTVAASRGVRGVFSFLTWGSFACMIGHA